MLAYRNEERVTLALLSRIMNRASGLLRVNDIDERMEAGERGDADAG